MKQLSFILFLFLVGSASAQSTNNTSGIRKTDSVYSQILQENRKIRVYIPHSDSNIVSTKQHYPVVYLLDAETDFNSMVERVKQLSEVKETKVIPQMIVVGIGSTDRVRDLTPTHVSFEPYFDSNLIKTSGNSENFTNFVEKELIPHIDSSYPTIPYRLLLGVSLGGLYTINTLINHTDLFNSYVAIDPYMQWDNQDVLKRASKVLNKNKFSNKSLFLAIGNTMQKGWDTVVASNDTSAAAINIRSILQLATTLRSNAPNGLHWSYKHYNGKDRGSIPRVAEHDALLYIFRNYKLPSFKNMLDSTFNVDSAVTAHFTNFSNQVGYRVLPPEPIINELGYAFMLNKMFDKAHAFFSININNYPRSFHTYDNLGDLYFVEGDKAKAIEYYTKALTLREFPNTRQKLERLKAEK